MYSVVDIETNAMWLHVWSKVLNQLPSLIQEWVTMNMVIPRYSQKGDSGHPILKQVGVGDIGIMKLKSLIDYVRLLFHICMVTLSDPSDLFV